MSAVWMRVRAELRARRRATLGLALLLGVMAGAATAAAAGARRTETAYPRFFERYRVEDLTLTTGAHKRSEEIFRLAANLPRVEATFRGSVYPGSVRTQDGKEAQFPEVFFVADHARPPGLEMAKVVSGRMTDPAAENEAMVNYTLAERFGIESGDVITITLVGASDGSAPPPPPQQLSIRITGVSARAGHFETVDGTGFPSTFHMTPAFQKRWSSYSFLNDDNFGIRLRHGDREGDYLHALEEELAVNDLADALDGAPLRVDAEAAGVQSLNRVPAVALWLLCAFIGVTTLAIFTQLFAREIRVGSQDNPHLRSIGMSRGDLFAVAMIRSTIIVGAGAAISVVVAFLVSPLTPVGLARIAEPDPGFAFTPGVMGLGAFSTVAVMSSVGAIVAWSNSRWAQGSASRRNAANTRMSDRLARAPFALSLRSGLTMAVDAGHGERAIPVRTALLGTSIAVAALMAALTFAASLSYLVDEPRLAGYTWDAGVIAAAFNPKQLPEYMRRIEATVARRFPSATLWRGTVFSTATVDGVPVATHVSDGAPPSIIDGRAPRGLDEVAVDPRTLDEIGKGLGDQVRVASGATASGYTMQLVGVFAFPRIVFQGENPGQGVAMTVAGFERIQPDADYTEALYVDFADGDDLDRGVAALRADNGDDAFAVLSRNQSPTVGNVERLSSLPTVLGALTGILGMAMLAHALTTTIRRRRRDLAILKTIGLVGRQVRGIVAWQSTAVVAGSLLIGVPIGIVAGRWGWRLFAEQLQVVPVARVSPAIVVAVVAGAVLAANLIAVLPGRIAARTQPALVLRTE